jgi:hypothetical protein
MKMMLLLQLLLLFTGATNCGAPCSGIISDELRAAADERVSQGHVDSSVKRGVVLAMYIVAHVAQHVLFTHRPWARWFTSQEYDVVGRGRLVGKEPVQCPVSPQFSEASHYINDVTLFNNHVSNRSNKIRSEKKTRMRTANGICNG